MSEIKFTGGKWVYNFETDGSVVSIQDRGKDIVVVEPDSANPHDSRLIACAPDLYYALDSLIIASEHLKPCPELIASAKKVLAKARGES